MQVCYRSFQGVYKRDCRERTVSCNSARIAIHYYILPSVIMDALDEGEARGSSQAKLETARILKQFGDSTQTIVQDTSLTIQEEESLN